MKRAFMPIAVLLLTATSAKSEQEDPQFQTPKAPVAQLPEPEGQPRNPLKINKIAGGSEVRDADYMAVVGMIYTQFDPQPNMPKCTGVLIHPEMVLTAAHCVCGTFVPTHIYVGRKPAGPRVAGHGYYEIRNGAMRTANGCAAGGAHNLKAGLDLALVKLIKPATGIRTYSMATAAQIDSAQSFRIVGFGATDTKALVHPWRKLRATVLPLSIDCTAKPDQKNPADYGCQTGEEIVAKGRGLTDTCAGDSGGPLLVTANPEGTMVQLAGITSRGIANSALKCGAGGIYERMTPEAVRWIDAAADELARS